MQRATFSTSHHEGILGVKLVQLVDSSPTLDRLVRQTLFVAIRDRRFDLFHTFNLIGADLHDSPTAISQKEVFFATLLINDHVERPVAVSQLSNCLPHDLGAWFQRSKRKLHEWRTRVGCQEMRLLGHGEWYIHPPRSASFK